MNKDIYQELRNKLKDNKNNTFNYIECIKEIKKTNFTIQKTDKK